MKSIIRTIFAAFALIQLVSCADLLVRDPKDQLSPEAFFRTEKDCQLYTNEFYLIFPGGDDIYGESEDYIVRTSVKDEMRGARLVPSSSGLWSWDRLRDINFFITHADQCSDLSVRNRYLALARFFRAYFYFDKIKHYGDVPWIDRPLTALDPELYKGRDSREIVFARMLEDIDFAIDNLPQTKDVHRVTKWTALALKSRMCLFEGTFRKYHNVGGEWKGILEECASASKTFISSSGYVIYNNGATPYRDLFSSVNSNTTEIVLTRSYSATLGMTHDANGYFTSTTMGRSGITKDVVNMYLMSDGSRFTDIPGYETLMFKEETVGRDPRLSQTIRTPGYMRIGSIEPVAPNMAATMTGYQIIKYVGSPKYDSYKTSETDLPLFRAAEVYLNFAEAKAELGTLAQGDLDISVNKLRSRVGMPPLEMDVANGNPDSYLCNAVTGYVGVKGENKGVILEIRRERTIELISEGFRYWDIMRWKEGKRFERPFYGMYFPGAGEYDLNGDGVIDFVIYTGTKPAEKEGVVYMHIDELHLSEGGLKGYITVHSDVDRKWNEDRDYLYPIPTDEITLTNNAIKQNPNW